MSDGIIETLTKAEREAPFLVPQVSDEIEWPTRLALDLEETSDGLMFAERDPGTWEIVARGWLVGREEPQ